MMKTRRRGICTVEIQKMREHMRLLETHTIGARGWLRLDRLIKLLSKPSRVWGGRE